VSVETTLLVLRAITGLLLMGFLGAVLAVLWSDYQAAAHLIAEGKRRRGRLVVIHTADGAPDGAISYPLLSLTSLGRAPTNTIVLADTFCSQEHALVTWRGGQWWLEDRHSSNGTLLNGERISEPVVISSGDVIGIGQIKLKLELE
jgi:hypothetical protein